MSVRRNLKKAKRKGYVGHRIDPNGPIEAPNPLQEICSAANNKLSVYELMKTVLMRIRKDNPDYNFVTLQQHMPDHILTCYVHKYCPSIKWTNFGAEFQSIGKLYSGMIILQKTIEPLCQDFLGNMIKCNIEPN